MCYSMLQCPMRLFLPVFQGSKHSLIIFLLDVPCEDYCVQCYYSYAIAGDEAIDKPELLYAYVRSHQSHRPECHASYDSAQRQMNITITFVDEKHT